MKFKIDCRVFEKFPGVRIGVLALKNFDNTKNKEKIISLLREEEKIQNQLLQGVEFGKLAQTVGWRQIYRDFGSKPGDYYSSIEALLRRVRSGSQLPHINPLVDLYNYLSIHHYLPVGAEDLAKIQGDVDLTFAKGDEKGRQIGEEKEETCYPGEVIYKDEIGFICRRWNWREADRTKIEENTKNAVLVLEVLPEIGDEKLVLALKEAVDLTKELLGAEITAKILSADQLEMEIN